MGQPKPPDPMQTARAQQGLNREGMADAVRFGQVGQDTPWGSSSYSGEIGSPDRTPDRNAQSSGPSAAGAGALNQVTTAEHDSGRSRGGGQGQGKQGAAQPMPAMNVNEPQPPLTASPCRSRNRPQPTMPQGPMMEDPPFGISGGGPHGPSGQPSLAEMMQQHGFPGMTSPYMRWK